MGSILSSMGINLGTRLSEREENEIPIHHKCRNCGVVCEPNSCRDRCVNGLFTRTGTKDQVAVIRTIVPGEKVRWSTSFDYKPIEFTSKKISSSTKEYVDKDPRLDGSIKIPWNSDDEFCDRRSYHGNYRIIDNVPQNPCGRTGVTGRGHLGHFGPNHAADPIVTRWKRDQNNKPVIHPKSQRAILEFVCINRRDTKELAIPGGMVDRKEKVTETLQREFHEEALHFPDISEEERHNLKATVRDIFENGGIRIYCGYVDDPRNTDNAWMETTVYNFHDGTNDHLGRIEVNGGDDALKAFWHELSSDFRLYASHSDFLRRVAELHKAHW